MSRAAYFIFSTPGVVWAMGIAAIWILLRPRSIVARRCAAAIAIAYLLASTYIVPTAFTGLLARPYHRFENPDVPRGRVALVVFGAGDEDVAGWDDSIVVPNGIGAARVLETWRVYRIAKPEWVISSGGNPYPGDDTEPSSVNMREMLVRLGVPPERIVLESTSRDSHDEAVLVAPLLRSLGADATILVTSAVHMRRSVGACRAAGWNPVPAVAPDPWFQNSWDDWLLPTNHALYFSGEVAHELLGIPYYRMRGWLR